MKHENEVEILVVGLGMDRVAVLKRGIFYGKNEI